MLFRLWHSGWLSLLLALAGGCGLLCAPPETGELIRKTVRDAAGPGGRAYRTAREWTSARAGGLRSVLTQLTAQSPATSQTETPAEARALAEAQFRQRQLEVRLAGLQERLQAALSENSRRLPATASSPLLQTVAVPARVIGVDRGAIAQLADRLIDIGESEGIVAADLVQQASFTQTAPNVPAAVIDQGVDAALEPDLPVTAGGVLVGRIRSTGRLTSSVQLVRDQAFRIGARLVRETASGPVFGASGVFAGGGEAACRLELVAASEPVAVGDRVFTQEHLAGETVALLIGTVATAELPTGATHWSITVVPETATPPLDVQVLRPAVHPERAAQAGEVRP